MYEHSSPYHSLLPLPFPPHVQIISPVSLSGPTDSQGASPVAIVAGVAGGVILVLVVVLLALLGVGICYRKKTTTRVDVSSLFIAFPTAVEL